MEKASFAFTALLAPKRIDFLVASTVENRRKLENKESLSSMIAKNVMMVMEKGEETPGSD